MIRRFAIVLVWTLLAAVTAYAQQTPAAEQPTTQEPTTQPIPGQPTTGQEPPEVETGRRRKVRPHDYLNWTFNVGAGVGLPSGTTLTNVSSGRCSCTPC